MKKWYKLLNPGDFAAIVNENGYQITFKGHKIGGAGIEPREFVSEEGKMLQKKNFQELAMSSIEKILAGSGDRRYYKEIREIMDI